MLPFSKIACIQCRQFAIRSFASAVAASTPSTSSNPAPAPLAIPLEVKLTPSSEALKAEANTVQDAGPPADNIAASSANEAPRSSKPLSTLAQLLEEQRLKSINPPVKRINKIVRKTPVYPHEPVPKIKVFVTYREIRFRRPYSRTWITREFPSASALSRPRKSPRSTDPIIIRPLDETTAAEIAALRKSTRAIEKFATSPSESHGRKKGRPLRRPSRKDTLSESVASVNASGFEKRDSLTVSSESGFKLAANASEERMDAAVAALERLSAKEDPPRDDLKELFARYLDSSLNVAAKRQIVREMRAQLQSQSAEHGDEALQALEDCLEQDTSPQAAETDALEGTLVAPEVQIDTVTPLKDAEVATLAHGLQRVLFNPGIHWLQHPRTGFYNYTKAVQAVADREEFDFQRLPKFVRPSQDADLRELLKQSGRRFAGSTSSLTSAMSQIYFALNSKKKLNTQTTNFVDSPRIFSAGARNPASIVLRLTNEGTYLVDADKSVDNKESNPGASVLSELGHVLERQLTLEPDQFSRFLKSSPDPFEPHEMREKREAYHYSASKNLVMRSQLDCHDNRLPRKTFDIKTRATVAIRMDTLNYRMNRGYLISKAEGALESFEREKYDLIRSAFLKYSMQVRIGNMDGIFLAYHSTGQIFGFEYLSLEELDKAISGSHEESTQAFHLCVGLLETIFERVTADQPATTLRLHLQGDHGRLQVFAEPRPDLSLSTTEQAENGEFKDKNDTAEVSSKDVRLYTFNVSSYLNGHEVKQGSPVDFASVPIEHIPNYAPPSSQASSQDVEENGVAPKSAFGNFLEQREKAEVASLDAEDTKLSQIIWSIKYTITESRDQKQVGKALKELRQLQRIFGKYVLLPEGLPDQMVNSIVGQRSTPPKKANATESSQTQQGPGGAEQAGQEKQSEDGKAVTGAHGEWVQKESSRKAGTLVEKWAAFRPRSGVRYTTTPTGLIASVRRLAAEGRKRLAAAAKAKNGKRPHSF